MLWIALIACIAMALGSFICGLYIVETDVTARANDVPAYLLGTALFFAVVSIGIGGVIIAT